MPVPKVEGKIDLTHLPGEQHISDRPTKGQTVYGTTHDDNGDESTDFVPSFVDRDAWTDRQLEVIAQKGMQPTAKCTLIADRSEASPGYVSRILKEFREEYANELEDRGLRDSFMFESPGRPQSDNGQPQSDREKVRAFFKSDPSADVSECINELGVDLSPSVVGGIKGGLLCTSERVDDGGNSSNEQESENVDTITCNIRGVLDQDLTDQLVGDGLAVLDNGNDRVMVVEIIGSEADV